MKRSILVIIAFLLLLTGCGGPQTAPGPRLNGMYSGVVYSSGYSVGGMAVDLTTSGGRLSGSGCFVALDSTYACNTLTGSLAGAEVAFRIGALRFSGNTNGYYIDTTFHADDGSVSGRVYFTEADTGAAAVARAAPQDKDAMRASDEVAAKIRSGDQRP